jgi:oligopeptide transport system permease protein
MSVKFSRGDLNSRLIFERMPVSFRVLIPEIAISLVLGYILGILMARYKGRKLDNGGLLYIYLTGAVPYIVYVYVMIVFFGVILRMQYRYSSSNLLTLIPPLVTMLIMDVGADASVSRRYMVDEMNADYVKFARAKGLGENRIFFTHILRNVSVFLFRGIPLAVVGALSGAYYTEMAFSITGIGRLLITACNARDNTLVLALTVIYAALTVFAYLISDILAVIIDPRVSLVGNK